jgi:RNA polymerase sigma-70 factor (ECF subfamily)
VADLRDQLVSEIPRLRRFAQGLVRNREIADDLVQDTLVWALTAEHRFQPGNVRVWLIVILLNLNRNRIRHLARRGPHVGVEEIDQSLTPPSLAPPLDILMALEHLSEDQREVLLLIGLEGLSYGECAQALSIPVGTVMSRLSRARQALRQLLGEPNHNNGQSHLRVIK